jgi:CCR4-NOT transcription complex subunit 7/8
MPPPQLRGFGAGPGVGAPFHQPGFPSHAHTQGGPLGANQYLSANPFAAANPNAFTASGLGGAAAGFSDTGFGAQSARLGFAHGPAAVASLQQAQHAGQVQQNVLMEHPTMRAQPNKGRIREVWKHNLAEEMAVLRDMVDKYPYIAMVGSSCELKTILTHAYD